MVDNGILYHVSKIKVNLLVLPMLQLLQEPLLLLKSFLSLIVRFDLLTAHAFHKPLPLAQGEGLLHPVRWLAAQTTLRDSLDDNES